MSVRNSEHYLEFLPASAEHAGLVFIAGAGVAREAYVPMLRPIADQGHPLIIVGLPYRIAPFDSHKDTAVRTTRAVIDSHPSTQSWVIAGHSLGGALTSRVVEVPPARLKAAVLIGTSHPKRQDLSGSAVPITKVFASNDGIATVDMINATRDLLPRSTRWVEIPGGNHSQFGHYGHQLLDRRPEISREQQQALTRAALLAALRN